MELATTMPTPPDISPLFLSKSWEGLQDLHETGFVQTAFGPVDTNPFVVLVSIPLRFEPGVPFYLYVRDANLQIEILIADDPIVDLLLVTAPGLRTFFCWAEISKGGQINFDTETDCPGW